MPEFGSDGFQDGLAIGMRQGIIMALEVNYGHVGLQLAPVVETVEDLNVLRKVLGALRYATTIEQIRELLK